MLVQLLALWPKRRVRSKGVVVGQFRSSSWAMIPALRATHNHLNSFLPHFYCSFRDPPYKRFVLKHRIDESHLNAQRSRQLLHLLPAIQSTRQRQDIDAVESESRRVYELRGRGCSEFQVRAVLERGGRVGGEGRQDIGSECSRCTRRCFR